MIIIFLVAIVAMVVAIARFGVHPFISILVTALVLAFALGIPVQTLPDTVGRGFSSIFTGIGLVIIFGTIIGSILDKTGAAVAMARAVERTVGRRFPRLAMLIIGWIVSIPVFCDSGFVLVSPVGRSLAARSGQSPVALSLALAAGLFASHVFIPPTPGPVAAAGIMGLENNLLLIIALGAVISIVALIPAYFFAGYMGKKVTPEIKSTEGEVPLQPTASADTPGVSAFAAFMPIVVPVLLMAIGSLAPLLGLPEGLLQVLVFLGKPFIALMIAAACCLPLLARRGIMSQAYSITQESLMTAGPIIFITAAGSVLGAVIVDSGFVDIIKEHCGVLSALGMAFPFLIAAILKSAQGSSTVAITTAASIMGMFNDSSSMMTALGYTSPLSAALVVMAIGAGAMTVSHANDSYFWVVTGFGGIKAGDGYRTMTLMTLLMGVAALVAILLASAILI
jgi:GntP family gluconate:H+ symporter